MLATLATISLLLQIANVALVVRLISATGRRTAWMFIAASMALAAILRFVMVVRLLGTETPSTSLTHEVLVVIISALLMTGLYLIHPLVESIRAAERTVRQSEKQYRSLFEDSPLAVIVGGEGRIGYANNTALALLGAERLDQLQNRPLTDFVPSRYQAFVTEQLQTISEEHPHHPISELQVVRQNGEVIDVEVLISMFIYAGQLAQYVVLWDVSDRKRREETLRMREAELAHVMRLHTMGEIAAEMAHEINQPLYAISNFAQAGILHLQSGEPERMAQLQTCLEHAHTQAVRAAQIVKNLRNFVSKTEGEFVSTPFHVLVRDALELVVVEARRRRASTELLLCKGDASILANAVQIQQVIVNLLLNAFEAMEVLPEGNRKVRVVTCLDTDHVELAVEDSGPGVAEDQLSRVFEPFFTSKPHGMGMGLAVSRTIVINHAGKIWAERNEQGGTTFRVRLPREKGDL